MPEDAVSLEFLGEQLKRVQADIRDLKGRVLLVESDQGDLRRDVARVEVKIDVLLERVDDRFDQVDRRFSDLFRVIADQFAALRNDLEGPKS